MGRVWLKAAYVAPHVEREHLPPSVAGEFDRAEEAAHDEEEAFRRIAFADDFLAGQERDDSCFEMRKACAQEFADAGPVAGKSIEGISHSSPNFALERPRSR